MKSTRAFFILCAGYGTRLKPFTKYLPKPLFTVKEQTLLGRHLKNIASQVSPIFMNIAYHSNALISYLLAKDLNINYIYEVEPCGVAGSLKLFCDMAPEIEQVFFMSSDLYLTCFDEALSFWKSGQPHVFVDDCGDYAGISIINTKDLKEQQFIKFKDFFEFMRENYTSSVLKSPLYNVGSYAQVPC